MYPHNGSFFNMNLNSNISVIELKQVTSAHHKNELIPETDQYDTQLIINKLQISSIMISLLLRIRNISIKSMFIITIINTCMSETIKNICVSVVSKWAMVTNWECMWDMRKKPFEVPKYDCDLFQTERQQPIILTLRLMCMHYHD